MPEGDTVWRTATRLNVALAGEPLEMLQLRWGDLGGQQLLPASTVSVTSRGKHLLHRLDNGVTVHSHLRTDGKWRLEATPAVDPSALANPHLRAVAATRTWTALGLHLGAVDIWPTSQEDAHLGHLGPDLLGDDRNSYPPASSSLRLQSHRPASQHRRAGAGNQPNFYRH